MARTRTASGNGMAVRSVKVPPLLAGSLCRRGGNLRVKLLGLDSGRAGELVEVDRVKDERDNMRLALVRRLGPVARRQGLVGKQTSWIACCPLAVLVGDLDDSENTRLPQAEQSSERENTALEIARVHERDLSRPLVVELATETVDDYAEVPAL